MLFDRSGLTHRPDLSRAAFLYAHALGEIIDRLAMVSRTFDRALYSGPVFADMEGMLAGDGRAWTIASPMADTATAGGPPMVAADLAIPFRRAFPLAVSVNDLHLADDPVRAMGEMRGALVPDGLFLAAVPARGTLGELSDSLIHAEAALTGGATMRVAPFGEVRQWGDGLAKAGFALPVADEQRLTVRYGDLNALLRDLTHMGMRGVLSERRPAPRGLFRAAEEHYRANHGDADGRLRATFAFAYLSGWAPDASQQKPAKRGSATMRLEDALNAARRD